MFPFTIRQLEIFLTVCETGTFRSAADALGITQAGVSNHIRALEAQLGYNLFERSRGTAADLTVRGRELKAFGLDIAAKGAGFKSILRKRRGCVRLLIGAHILEECIRPALPNFFLRYPDIELEFVSESLFGTETSQTSNVDCTIAAYPEHVGVGHATVISQVFGGIYAAEELKERYDCHSLDDLPAIIWPWPTDETLAKRQFEYAGIQSVKVVARVQYFDAAIRLACEGIGAVHVRESMLKAIDKERKLKLLSDRERWDIGMYLRPSFDKKLAEIVVPFLVDSIKAVEQARAEW